MSYASALRILGADDAPTNQASPDDLVAEAARIQAVLTLARDGKASLTQLADAYDIASKRKLYASQVEIRKHIVGLIKPPAEVLVTAPSIGKSLIIGIIAGFIVHFFMASRKPEPASKPAPEEPSSE